VSVLGFGASPNSPSIPTSVCVDDIGRHLVVGRDDRHISVYDLHAGKVVKVGGFTSRLFLQKCVEVIFSIVLENMW